MRAGTPPTKSILLKFESCK